MTNEPGIDFDNCLAVKQYVAEEIRKQLFQLEYHFERKEKPAGFDLAGLQAQIEAWISDSDTLLHYMEEARDYLHLLGVFVIDHQRAIANLEQDVKKILRAIQDEQDERAATLKAPEGLPIQ
jgi:hypothetical protein